MKNRQKGITIMVAMFLRSAECMLLDVKPIN